MMYKTHGIADLDFDLIMDTLDTIPATCQSASIPPDDWYDNRDTKAQYSSESLSFWEYEHPEIDRLIPQDIFDQFDLDKNNTEIRVVKFPPGSFTPPHVDRFTTLKTRLNLENTNNVVRVWMPMEDPKFGHALFVEHDTVHDVPRGTMITWDHSAIHSACNAGLQDRYIMTITGVVNS